MTDLFEIIRQTDMIADIKKDPRKIAEIDNPIESLQLAAIEYSSTASILVGIPALTTNAQIAAVKKWNDALRHIENPSRVVINTAVKSSAYAIRYVNTPSRRLQLMAVKQNPNIIYYIGTPCVEAELLAWTLDKKTAFNPCTEVKKLQEEDRLHNILRLKEKYVRKELQQATHIPEKKQKNKNWRNYRAG